MTNKNYFTIEEAFKIIKDSKIQFDQLIQENNEWLHISYNPIKNRRECLRMTKENGASKYDKA